MGKESDNSTKPEWAILKDAPQPTHIVNVKELNKPKNPHKYKEEYWHDKLVYWILISLVGSLIFGLMAIVNSQFLYITPIFPILGFFSWSIRRLMKERGLDKIHEEKESSQQVF